MAESHDNDRDAATCPLSIGVFTVHYARGTVGSWTGCCSYSHSLRQGNSPRSWGGEGTGSPRAVT